MFYRFMCCPVTLLTMQKQLFRITVILCCVISYSWGRPVPLNYLRGRKTFAFRSLHSKTVPLNVIGKICPANISAITVSYSDYVLSSISFTNPLNLSLPFLVKFKVYMRQKCRQKTILHIY